MLVQKKINAREDVGCWMMDVSWERETAKSVIPAKAGIQVLPSFIPTCALRRCWLRRCWMIDVSWERETAKPVIPAEAGIQNLSYNLFSILLNPKNILKMQQNTPPSLKC